MYTEVIITETLPARKKDHLSKTTQQPEIKKVETALPITMGYGECSVSGCNCRAYMGSADTCENCGHNKELHRY